MKLIALAVAVAGLVSAGPPTAPPPKPAQPGGPPPAWAETGTVSMWLAYGSYCWRTGCADYIPPPQRPGIPLLTVRRGALVRFHLAFTPSDLKLRLIPSGKKVALSRTRVAVWRSPTAGIVSLEARGAGGSASYVLRVRVR